MKCVILVAGHSTRLERELREDTSHQFSHLVDVPKALLPGPTGRRLLDNWWQTVSGTNTPINATYLVTNAAKYKYFDRWATASNFPRENIINDGTTAGSGPIGALADLDLALRSRKVDEDILVIAGDMLFNPNAFDLDGVLQYFKSKGGELACYYQMLSEEDTRTRGIMELDGEGRVTKFLEKPSPDETASRLASVVLYCFRKESLPLLREFLAQHSSPDVGFGHFLAWLSQKEPVYGMKLPDHFSLIGSVGLKEYIRCLQQTESFVMPKAPPITCRAYARVGLMGNPSDGFFGKTISLSIANYWAEATICQSERLILERHPLNDPTEFGSMADLYAISRREGYQGGLRLMQATCKKFFEYCTAHGIAVPKRNFKLKYDTNIPRQVGLAGSSAICTAVLQCLMSFFNVTDDDIPKPIQASFVLSVETLELGINAGLQDRVIQAYGGCVFMNFDREIMKRGYGEYIPLDMSKLPQFWLGYLADPSDSGKIHSDVRQRFDSGDKEAIDAMAKFADLTEQARVAIEAGDHAKLADLMDANFSLRRQLYGDPCLGDANLKMVEIALKHKSAVKFPGSGGAVVGLCRPETDMKALKEEIEEAGIVFVNIIPNPARP